MVLLNRSHMNYRRSENIELDGFSAAFHWTNVSNASYLDTTRKYALAALIDPLDIEVIKRKAILPGNAVWTADAYCPKKGMVEVVNFRN